MCKFRYVFSGILLWLMLGVTKPLTGQDKSIAGLNGRSDSALQISGYAQGFGFGGGKRYNMASLFGEMGFRTNLYVDKAWFAGDVRIRSGWLYNEHQTVVEVKELYAGFRSNKMDFLVGNQIVSWGRTDGVNPTGNLYPSDYFFLTPDPDDQRLPNFMVRTRLRITPEIELDLIAVPFYRPSVYRYDLFELAKGVNVGKILFPEKRIGNSSLAARFNVELPAIGFSVSWFTGFDPFYGCSIDTFNLMPTLVINLEPQPYRKYSIGADIALPVQAWMLRAEAAYNLTSDYEKNVHIPNPAMFFVAGIERSIAGTTAILQYVGHYVSKFKTIHKPVMPPPVPPTDPGYLAYIQAMLIYGNNKVNYESELINRRLFNQLDRSSHLAMITLNRFFAYETLKAELTGLYNFTTLEYMARSGIDWKVTDHLAVKAGFSLMKGPDESLYKLSGEVLNGGYFGLKVSF